MLKSSNGKYLEQQELMEMWGRLKGILQLPHGVGCNYEMLCQERTKEIM